MACAALGGVALSESGAHCAQLCSTQVFIKVLLLMTATAHEGLLMHDSTHAMWAAHGTPHCMLQLCTPHGALVPSTMLSRLTRCRSYAWLLFH